MWARLRRWWAGLPSLETPRRGLDSMQVAPPTPTSADPDAPMEDFDG
jgi:hypothetical protein